MNKVTVYSAITVLYYIWVSQQNEERKEKELQREEPLYKKGTAFLLSFKDM